MGHTVNNSAASYRVTLRYSGYGNNLRDRTTSHFTILIYFYFTLTGMELLFNFVYLRTGELLERFGDFRLVLVR